MNRLDAESKESNVEWHKRGESSRQTSSSCENEELIANLVSIQ